MYEFIYDRFVIRYFFKINLFSSNLAQLAPYTFPTYPNSGDKCAATTIVTKSYFSRKQYDISKYMKQINMNTR